MIPTKTIEELITKHSTLEKDLSSGNLDTKVFAEKSKEYSDVNEIILNAKKYLSFENEKQELEKLLEDNTLDKELKNNPDLKEKWQSRQKSYQAEREELANDNSEPQATGGVGGATESIKCLHSHTADELSTGKNVIGKIVVESIGSFNCEEACIDTKTFRKNKEWKVIW